MQQKRTELKELGEFGLIDKISQSVQILNKETIQGIGDDCAVIEVGTDAYWLMSADMLMEGIHFDLSYFPLKHLGYKAVVANVSDIAAMNGIPKQLTVSLAVSNRFSVEAIEELYVGIRAACQNYKVDLVGGDVSSSRSGLVISIAITGTVAKNKIAYRKQAKDNEIICVTGDLGGAFIGLQLLEREKQVFMVNPDMQPQLEEKEYVVMRQLKPEARTDMVYEFLEAEVVPTSMIDISDGLASELLHLCKNSGLGSVIFEDKLPIDSMTYHTALEFNLDPTTCLMNGGEDYELLFTIRQEDYEKIKHNPNITAIGYMTEKTQEAILRTKGDNLIPIKAQGWNHF